MTLCLTQPDDPLVENNVKKMWYLVFELQKLHAHLVELYVINFTFT